MTDTLLTNNPPPLMRRYTFKLYPTRHQADALHEQRQMMADLWNALLERRETIWQRTKGQRGVTHSEDKSTYSLFDMQKEITVMRNALPEWAALSSATPALVAKSLDLAFAAFFRRVKDPTITPGSAGYPRYQSRHRADRIPYRSGENGSGCKLVQCTTPHSPARRGTESFSALPHPARRDNTERQTASPSRNWRLTLKGIPGHLHARGYLPAIPTDIKTADVLWRDGVWWVSIAAAVPPRRSPGRQHMRVDFDLLDGLARVNGMLVTPPKLALTLELAERIDRAKSELATRWPKRTPSDPEWRALATRISRLSAHQARVRHECLHVWTANIVAQASDLTITTPRLTDIRTPRGDEKKWGANVASVAELNRNILSYSCGAAVNMLLYKAAEAGIRCDVSIIDTSAVTLGQQLVETGKRIRRARKEAA